jgi:hypothetical protein
MVPLPYRKRIEWLGKKDSNLRMPESKSGALTNLATPQQALAVCVPASEARIIQRIFQKKKGPEKQTSLPTRSGDATPLRPLENGHAHRRRRRPDGDARRGAQPALSPSGFNPLHARRHRRSRWHVMGLPIKKKETTCEEIFVGHRRGRNH